MIKEEQKLDENKLAEFIYNDILYQLESINKHISNEFKYDRVVLKAALVPNFSFEKVFKILEDKRLGIYRYRDYESEVHLMFDFRSI